MTNYDSGDVILVRIVFTDLSGAKVRPALVVSNRAYTRRFGDLVVLPLTSQRLPDKKLTIKQWKEAGLVGAAWIKPLVISIASSDVVRRLGELQSADDGTVQHAIRLVIDERWLK